nr:hypothetical protein [Eubacterium sp.]
MNRNLYLKYEWKRLFWPVVLGLAGVFLQLGVLFRQIVLGLSQGDGVFNWKYTGTVFDFSDYNEEFTSSVHTFIYQVASSVNMIPFVLFVLFLVAVQFSDRHSLKRVEFMNSLPVREKDLVGNKLLVGLSCIGGLWVILTGGILAMKAYFKTAIMEEIAYKTNVEKLLANDSMTNLWIFLLSTLVLICMDYLIFAAFHIIVKKNLLANIFSLAFTGAPFLILWFVYGYYKNANDMF